MGRFPVSVKGVMISAGRVALLENERGEWELPGGKLEERESPEECVGREIREELNLRADVGPLLDAWVYEVFEEARVLILTYGCFVEGFRGLARSEEHSDAGLFDIDELARLKLPDGYRRSIEAWRRHPALPPDERRMAAEADGK